MVNRFFQSLVRISVENPRGMIGAHLLLGLLLLCGLGMQLVQKMAPLWDAYQHPAFGMDPIGPEQFLDEATLVLFNNGMSNTLGSEAPEIKNYLEFQQDYPEDEVILAVVEAPVGLAREEALSLLKPLAGRLQLPDVARVHWAGTLSIAPASFLDSTEASPAVLQQLAGLLPQDPVARTVWHSQDGRDVWLFYVFLSDQLGDRDTRRLRIDNSINQEVQSFVVSLPGTGWKGTVMGIPSTLGQMVLAIAKTVVINFGIVNVVVVLLCVGMFRHVRGVVLMVAALLQSQALTILPFLLTGHTFDWVNANLTTSALLMGVAGSIHCLHAYLEQRRHGRTAAEAVVATWEEILGPYAFAIITSMVAFIALEVTSSVPSVVEYGVFSTLGLAVCFLIDMTFLSALFVQFDKETPKKFPLPWMEKLTLGLAQAAFRRSSLTLGLSLLIFLVVGVGGTYKLVQEDRVNSNVIDYFDQSTPIFQAERTVRALDVGIVPAYLEVTLATDWNLAQFQRLDQFLTELRGLSGFPARMQVHNTFSMADLLQEGCLAFADLACDQHYPLRIEEALPRLPAAEMLIPQQDGQPKKRIRTMILTDSMYSTDGPRFQDLVLRTLQKHFPEVGVGTDTDQDGKLDWLGSNQSTEVGGRLRGMSLVWWSMEKRMMREILQGFVLALVPIIGMLILVFRRFRTVMLSLVPNIAPIPIALGLYGWLGWYLPTPALFAISIAAGVICDDTMMLIGHLEQAEKHTDDPEEQLKMTMHGSGIPVFATNVVLALGAATLLTADLKPIAHLGGVVSLILLIGLFGDLLLLPAVLGFLNRREV